MLRASDTRPGGGASPTARSVESLDSLLAALPPGTHALAARLSHFVGALRLDSSKRVEDAVAEVNRAWLERWKTRDTEWRDIVLGMKSKYSAAQAEQPSLQVAAI